MMCLGHSQEKNYRSSNMAPNAQGYLSSCWQKCSTILDSIWNPWGVKKSQKFELLSAESSSIAEEPYLSYGFHIPDKPNDCWVNQNPLPTKAFVNSMSGYVRSVFLNDYYTLNMKTLPVDLMYHSYVGTHKNHMSSVMLKQSSMMNFSLNTDLLNIEALDKLMTECAVQRSIEDCAPRASPAKIVSSRPKQGKSTLLTVSVVEVERNVAKLNQELVSRKNRELKKCSKKRRRRQKKQNKCDISNVTNVSDDPPGCGNSLKNECMIGRGFSNSLPECKKQSNANSNCRKGSHNPKVVTQAKIETQNCTNPLISFIMGHINESDSDSDFGDEAEIADVEFCFTNSLNTVTVGLRSISLLPEDTKHSRADCTISIVNFQSQDVSPEVIDANERWNRTMANVKLDTDRVIKVSFPEENELTSIFPAEVYDRKSEWEIYALERFRFKTRIEEAQRILSPVLTSHHREKILQRLDIEV